MGGSQVAQVEEEEEGAITPRESGIARAVIASERRPHPAEGWVEVDIRGKSSSWEDLSLKRSDS